MEKEHKFFKVNQNAIIIDQSGKILILKNNLGWSLPGGRLENDDTWQAGFVREIREETGIQKVEDIKIVDVDMSESKETYMTYFTCRVLEKPIVQLSSEHTEYAWVDVDTLDAYQFIYPNTKKKIEMFLSH